MAISGYISRVAAGQTLAATSTHDNNLATWAPLKSALRTPANRTTSTKKSQIAEFVYSLPFQVGLLCNFRVLAKKLTNGLTITRLSVKVGLKITNEIKYHSHPNERES